LCGGLLLLIAAFAQAPLTREQAYRRAKDLSELGRAMFFDPALSASGKMSCSTCHDPRYAYGPAPGRAIALRAAPSLKYLQTSPAFTEHYFDSETTGDDSIDNGPTGGLTWDGRVDRGRDQARLPLLSKEEMGNQSVESLVERARGAKFGGRLAELAGRGATVDAMYRVILEALEAFQQDYREFYPYSSKYDAYLAGKAVLSAREGRGLELFVAQDKGDCARCHIATRGVSGTPPQFTDYGLIAIGVPRNPEIRANRDPRFYDLGLCGPVRTDFEGREEYCGRFLTPTLRNVALRQEFFHNGAVKTLREAVAFYVDRDSKPIEADLPARYRANVETGAPFGGTPQLNATEIDDIVEFLRTLTDGTQ
jgi:cytochrome c peroxidase